MALTLNHLSSSSFNINKPYPPFYTKPTIFQIKSQQTDETNSDPSTKKPGPGLGFGSKNNKQGKKERASIIRREPVEKPSFATPQQAAQSEEMMQNEKAFLLTWSGLGAVILFQGLSLAVSGFLPEEWDNVVVKYIYPSFTPTVFSFVAGTVVYGVLKYFQNEKLNDEN